VKKNQTVEEEIIVCDTCGANVDIHFYVCKICKKDLCDLCVKKVLLHVEVSPTASYCKQCLEIGKPFINKLKDIGLEFDALRRTLNEQKRTRITPIMEQWKQASSQATE
jgi:hypothetical protein